jgi:type IX secretion system PorP/SprF family membrane protein
MKQAIKILFVICVAAAMCLRDSYGQDPHFTQFYAAQTYLNPAFTGIHGCTRFSSNFRDQWPAIPGSFISYTFSYDQYFNSINSSFGLLAVNDQAGSGRLRSTGVNLLYAYEIPLADEWRIRAGLQGGLSTRNVNYHDLIFGDQIARGGAATSLYADNTEMALYPDLSTGALVYSEK